MKKILIKLNVIPVSKRILSNGLVVVEYYNGNIKVK